MKFYNSIISAITPYTAGEQPKDRRYIKLNTNENPYPPSPKIKAFLSDYQIGDLKLYPDPASIALRQQLAKKYNVDSSNIFVSNGSDEALAFIFKAFFEPNDRRVAFADITYTFYSVFADINNVRYQQIPLNQQFEINVDDYLNLQNCQGIVIANPNAPTSIALPLVDIERIICANTDKLVVIDEAYVDFCLDVSAADLVKKYDNLIVVQTFSKSYALAGIRCGYAIACENLIKGLEIVKDSFNSYPIDRLCEGICTLAAEDTAYYQNTINAVIDTRIKVTTQLEKMGCTVLPSSANFLFVAPNKLPASGVYLQLRQSGALVRYFNKPRIDNYLRITIGTPKQMKELLEKLAHILGV